MTGDSALTVTDGGARLELATGLARTPQGLVPGAKFFGGFVARADITAAGLLTVADVAGTLYADVGAAQRLAMLDPVVTAGGDRLRFESFSLCNGVYARFDLLRDGLGSSEVGFGTTNVDVNQPLRTSLARIGASEALHLEVGADELRVSSLEETHVEPKVTLPDRWVRGLAETSRLLAEMEPVASIQGGGLRQFFSKLPRVAPPGPSLHVLPLASGWRTITRSVPGSVGLPGASRLRGSDRVLRHTDMVTLHRHRHGSTAWVFHLPGARLTLALTPGPYRGFSGEGALLGLLAHPEAESNGRRLLVELAWSSVIDPDVLAQATGLSQRDVKAGLGWLAASGRLGYDLDEGAYFYRELPVDSEAVLRRNPRLVSAQKLLDSGGVRAGASQGEWWVRGSQSADYLVSTEHCTCPWEVEHQSTRGAEVRASTPLPSCSNCVPRWPVVGSGSRGASQAAADRLGSCRR